MTRPEQDELGAAVVRYASSVGDVDWLAPSDLRKRAEWRRRKRRIVATSGSLVVAVLVTVSLTLPSTAAKPRTSPGSQGLTTHVTRAVVAPGSASEVAVEHAEEGFALALTQSLVSGDGHDNVVVSPESVETVLTMLELGARGSTQTAIARVLQSSNLSPTVQAAGWNALTAELASDARTSGGTLADANAVFVQNSLVVRSSYLRALETNFGAGVEHVNFQGGPAEAVQAINSWATQATGGLIKRLLSSSALPSVTRLVLADAVQFSAGWQVPFISSSQMAFSLASGHEITVRMMHLSANLRYFSTDSIEGVVLPYAGGKFDAVAVTPREGSLSSIVASLTPASLALIASSTSIVPVVLSLPTFSISSGESLDGSLQSLGLGPAFMDGADFSGITADEIKLGTVAQRDVLSVGTRGTDFTSVTVGTTIRFDNRGSIHVVTFDQPFLFVIRDVATGAVVTEAVVNDPLGSR